MLPVSPENRYCVWSYFLLEEFIDDRKPPAEVKELEKTGKTGYECLIGKRQNH
jgi:hypothetical protein